ncbi:MAG TPA: hypothetical protein VM184_01030 [Gaiellaceae bacterium]|nr:hypothetical protein [Gaiellaceae bacterium]
MPRLALSEVLAARAPRLATRTAAYRAAIGAVLVCLTGLALWNAHTISPDLGYDATNHQLYARVLAEERRLPRGDEERAPASRPPGFYAVAAAANAAGEWAALDDPHKALQYLNAVLVLVSALLALVFVREVCPGRRGLHVASLAFFAFVPVVLKSAAMYYPGTLALALCTGGLALTARMLRRRDFRLRLAAAVGVLLVAGILVMLHALWVYLAVVCALVLAGVGLRERRRPALAAAAVVAGVALLPALPWFARQALTYGDPLWGYRFPLSAELPRDVETVFALHGPELVTEPWRPSYMNVVVPTAYSELWGDYFGVFAWNSAIGPTPPEPVATALRAQMVAGAVPTALALAGWLALFALAVRRAAWSAHPERLLVALLPAFGLLGFWYYVMYAASPDGDTVKATYLLTTAPAWAVAFGFAFERLAVGRVAPLLIAALALAAVADLRFLTLGSGGPPW